MCEALSDKDAVEIVKHIDNLHYVLIAKTPSENSVEASNDGTSTITRDTNRPEWTLGSFAKLPEAKEANLSLIELASLRLYTTSTFALINRPLRASGTKLADELRSSRHPLAITTAHIGKGLKKLRALNFRDIEEKDDGEYNAPKGLSEYLWRGMKDVVVNDEFMSYGGSELGCMSTSESLKIIANYAYSSSPLLFRIKVETPMDRGARLKWLSVYPDEDEVLYPPLTYLKPMLKQKIKGMGGEVVTLKAVFPS
mmetsp:Transcript_66231/g.147851  ORF Transcript_66231/g.147851 Transcript_66231/m.147851 type:complete len:254 (-) Transcript_66231:330-1091(-)